MARKQTAPIEALPGVPLTDAWVKAFASDRPLTLGRGRVGAANLSGSI